MLEHHIQKTIVYALAHSDGLRFAELQPDGLENKLFDYHLKILIRDSFVRKTDDGIYELTPEGKAVWSKQVKVRTWYSEVPYSVVFMVVRRKSDGAWLFARRKTQPLYGMTGFLHAAPTTSEEITEVAKRVLAQKTGLDAEFEYRGSGFLRIYNGDELESFTNFSMVCAEVAGDISITSDELADYYWANNPEEEKNLIPNMPTLLEAYISGEQFFIEKTINF
jgi:hypothetical protein